MPNPTGQALAVQNLSTKTVAGFTSNWNAAFNPVIYRVTSKLYPNNLYDDEYDLTSGSIEDDNGLVLVNMGTIPANFKVKLFVRILNSTDYDGIWKIVSSNGLNTITLDLTFTTAQNLTIVKSYSNYYLECETYINLDGHPLEADQPYVLAGTKKIIPAGIGANYAQLDLSNILRYYIDSFEFDEVDYFTPTIKNLMDKWSKSFKSTPYNLGFRVSEYFDDIDVDGNVYSYLNQTKDSAEDADIQYLVSCAMQPRGAYGSNLYEYVPQQDQTPARLAKFMTDAERWAVFAGKPFSFRAIITDEILTGAVQQDTPIYYIVSHSYYYINTLLFGEYQTKIDIVMNNDMDTFNYVTWIANGIFNNASTTKTLSAVGNTITIEFGLIGGIQFVTNDYLEIELIDVYGNSTTVVMFAKTDSVGVTSFVNAESSQSLLLKINTYGLNRSLLDTRTIELNNGEGEGLYLLTDTDYPLSEYGDNVKYIDYTITDVNDVDLFETKEALFYPQCNLYEIDLIWITPTGWEMFTFTGKKGYGFDVKEKGFQQKDYMASWDFYFRNNKTQKGVISQVVNSSIKVNSQPVPLDIYQNITTIVKSPQIYMVVGDQLRTVLMNTTSLDTYKEGDKTFVFSFEIGLTIEEIQQHG